MPATRKTSAAKPAAKTARKPPAKPTPATPEPTPNPKAEQLKKSAEQERNGMSPAQKKKLAAEIIKLRAQGVRWDGEGGVCERVGVKTALVGRALMREFGKADLIKPLT